MAGRRKKEAVEPTAYQRALSLLVRREHSRKELVRKLGAKGVESPEMDAALETLSKQNFQNDARFAQALARTRAASGYGPVRIRAELGLHGLDREAVETALDACERDWDAVARDLIAHRYAGKASDPTLQRKALDFLLRRGFERKSAYAAVKSSGRSPDSED